jgi:hypothetical protein
MLAGCPRPLATVLLSLVPSRPSQRGLCFASRTPSSIQIIVFIEVDLPPWNIHARIICADCHSVCAI